MGRNIIFLLLVLSLLVSISMNQIFIGQPMAVFGQSGNTQNKPSVEWNTISDNKLGISFNYPAVWKLVRNPGITGYQVFPTYQDCKCYFGIALMYLTTTTQFSDFVNTLSTPKNGTEIGSGPIAPGSFKNAYSHAYHYPAELPSPSGPKLAELGVQDRFYQDASGNIYGLEMVTDAQSLNRGLQFLDSITKTSSLGFTGASNDGTQLFSPEVQARIECMKMTFIANMGGNNRVVCHF